jgi:hypothetical protein
MNGTNKAIGVNHSVEAGVEQILSEVEMDGCKSDSSQWRGAVSFFLSPQRHLRVGNSSLSSYEAITTLPVLQLPLPLFILSSTAIKRIRMTVGSISSLSQNQISNHYHKFRTSSLK